MTTKEEAVTFIQGFNKPKEHICLIIWSVEDVEERARETNIKITRAEAEEILDKMENNHDATIGVNWDTIGAYLYDLNSERLEKERIKKTKEQVEFT